MTNDRAGGSEAPDVTWVDLSAFGATYKGRRVWGPIGLVFAVFVAGIAALVGLVFLWYLVSLLGPAFERAGGILFALIAILACIAVVVLAIRFRFRLESGVDELVSEADLSPGDLDRIVPRSGIALRQLLDRIRAFAVTLGPRVKVRPTADPVMRKKAQQQTYIAGGLIGGGLLVFWFASANIGAVMMLASVVFFTRAVRARQPSIAELREQDKRRPILLLRSFRDDRLVAPRPRHYLFWVINTARRFEQAIAGSFQTFGPLIAIGEPGEKLPPIGAARTYLSDQDWQQAVLGWIEESLLIVMIAGSTQWIRWELHRILEKDRSRHLVILMPPDPRIARFWKWQRPASREDRWANVLASLADTEWSPALRSIDTRDLLLVELKSAGKVTATRADNALVPTYLVAIAVAIDDEFVAPEAKAA